MISLETEYPEHWLIAGGPCTNLSTTWRGGMCLKCNGKTFEQAQSDTDLEWLDRFRAQIDKHDAIDCTEATQQAH